MIVLLLAVALLGTTLARLTGASDIRLSLDSEFLGNVGCGSWVDVSVCALLLLASMKGGGIFICGTGALGILESS